MSSTNTTVSVVTEAAKSAPPVAISGVMLTGPSAADQASIIVSVLTGIYVLLQVFFLLKREYRARQARHGRPTQ